MKCLLLSHPPAAVQSPRSMNNPTHLPKRWCGHPCSGTRSNAAALPRPCQRNCRRRWTRPLSPGLRKRPSLPATPVWRCLRRFPRGRRRPLRVSACRGVLYITGDHSIKDLRYTQKPIYLPIFTITIWSY